MKKENGIKRLNRLSVKSKEYRDENTQVVKLSQAIEVVELLDEPEKPVVKQFVADWYESRDINQLDSAIAFYCNARMTVSISEYDDFDNWFSDDNNKPIETLIKMKLYGYEVVKEPKWVVKLGNSYLYEPMADVGSNGLIRLTRNKIEAYRFEGKEMADIHIDKFGGEAEEVQE